MRISIVARPIVLYEYSREHHHQCVQQRCLRFVHVESKRFDDLTRKIALLQQPIPLIINNLSPTCQVKVHKVEDALTR